MYPLGHFRLSPVVASPPPPKNVSTPVVGHRDRKLITPPAIGERNIVVTVSVCLSICEHISKTTYTSDLQ